MDWRERNDKGKAIRNFFFILFAFALIIGDRSGASQRDWEIQGNKFISHKPPFTFTFPSEFEQIHSFSHDHPGESSLTRVYFFVKTRGKQVEEMFILQMADKTNPQAGPITAPPLKPYSEERMYQKGKAKKGELEISYLIQFMVWNPNATSLQPLLKKGWVIPSCGALQGQLLFIYQGEHAVLIRYSKDISSFGLKVSEKGEDWGRETIKGNEKRVYDTFQKMFMEMIHSIQIKNP